jgi:hypothetical protein
MNKILVFFFCLCWCSTSFGQNLTQKISGIVLDNASSNPIPFVNIIVVNSNKGTTTDTLGNFTIANIPIGRYDIKVTAIGYEPYLAKEIEVISAKETFLNIVLKETATTLQEVVVKPKVNKASALNPTASVSAKMLSVEEAKRYAGGFDDPARLVSAFAGVSSSVNNNGIVVRGNNPKSLQWKFEGVEISNPNHFADLAAFGGGGLSALSSQCLANSDFFSGVFPAEYNNALSGVFDISMRTGNRNKRENTIQIGLTGIDLASEGPIKKGSRSSYLFNYRYSTLALLQPILPENGSGVKYQDLSFKLNFPTKKSGTFSFWGIGLIDGSGQEAEKDSSKWETLTVRQTQDVKQYMGALGVSHKYFLNKKSYIKSTLASSFNGIDLTTDQLNSTLTFTPENKIKNNTLNFVFSSFVNTKFSTSHTNKTGFSATNMRYNLLLKKDNQSTLQTLVSEDGNSNLLNVYSNSTINFNNKLETNIGVAFQYFSLNNNYSIEPRIGTKYQLNESQSISFAYGLHSRLEPINYYFTKNSQYGTNAINKEIDFTKAHHFVLGYDNTIDENLHLRIEAYYQNLFNVPVIKDSSFSFINLQNDWFFNEKLQNTGKGKNYGIDISLDKYMTNGFYYMFTSSIFNSQYKGGDNIWRNTRYNRNYAFNFLAGKEWQLGDNKQKVIGINVRASYQGGDRHSPIDATKSTTNQKVEFDENKAFSKQISPSFTTHFSILYRKNKAKTTTEWAFKVLNATMFKEFYGFQYNYKTQIVTEHRETIFIPNLSYKIQF